MDDVKFGLSIFLILLVWLEQCFSHFFWSFVVYLLFNNNNKQFSIPLRQIFTSKKWLHQSGSGIISVNKINTSSGLADTNKDRKHAKHQNIKTPNVQTYTKERKQNIKVNIYKLKLQYY